MCLLLLDVSCLIVVQCSISKSIWAHGDLAHASMGFEYCALRQGLGPVGDVHTGFGALVAPDITRSAVVTGVAPVIRAGENRGVRWPPVPAHLLKTFHDGMSQLAEGQRRHLAGGFGWIGRVARDAGDTPHGVIEVARRVA